jgi:hypothetical protein
LTQPVGHLAARRNVLTSAIVIAAYFCAGIVPFWHLLSAISHRLFSTEEDFALFAWFLGWVPHALAHGLNPFFSNAIYVPTGINLAQNTSAPLLGLITAPFTLIFGPIVSANLLLVLAMPISATAAFVVLRKWRVWSPAAALGGLMYGFSPYVVGQGLGHPQLMFLPIPPFIALTIASILLRSGSSQRLGVQLGLLVTAQYLIEPEVLSVTAFFVIAAMACVSVRYRANVPDMARPVSRPLGIAFLVAVALLAYPMWMLIAGPQHFGGPTFSVTNPYHNDALSFVVPGPLQKASLGMQSVRDHLVGTGFFVGNNPTEAGGYIGIPLLVLAGIFGFRSRRSPRMQLVVVLLLGSALLSLGPYLSVNGHLTHFPLPFLVVNHLPLLDNILPSRISFAMDACLAAIVAFGLDDMRRVSVRNQSDTATRQWRSTAFAGVSLAVLISTQLPQWPYPSEPAHVFPAQVRMAVPSGDPVAITYPYAAGTFSYGPMVWQAEDGYAFRLLGGYGAHLIPRSKCPDFYLQNHFCNAVPELMDPPGLQQYLNCFLIVCLYGNPPSVRSELVAATRTTLSRYRVRLVVVDRSFIGSGHIIDLFTEALGPPNLSVDQFSVWSGWPGSLGPLSVETSPPSRVHRHGWR